LEKGKDFPFVGREGLVKKLVLDSFSECAAYAHITDVKGNSVAEASGAPGIGKSKLAVELESAIQSLLPALIQETQLQVNSEEYMQRRLKNLLLYAWYIERTSFVSLTYSNVSVLQEELYDANKDWPSNVKRLEHYFCCRVLFFYSNVCTTFPQFVQYFPTKHGTFTVGTTVQYIAHKKNARSVYINIDEYNKYMDVHSSTYNGCQAIKALITILKGTMGSVGLRFDNPEEETKPNILLTVLFTGTARTKLFNQSLGNCVRVTIPPWTFEAACYVMAKRQVNMDKLFSKTSLAALSLFCMIPRAVELLIVKVVPTLTNPLLLDIIN
jgi:hypothetical protein